MTMLAERSGALSILVRLEEAEDFAAWRDEARELILRGIAPDDIVWEEPDGASGHLFAGDPSAWRDRVPPLPGAPGVRVERDFLELAQAAFLHRDPGRLGLLYRLLWRQQSRRGVMADRVDADVGRIGELARQVRRDIHKMRAFLRFRLAADPDGVERYVAWFEPEHRILRANARFFVDRFANMRWSILTPLGALHWDRESLREGPPASRSDGPEGDAAEGLWQRYYASIFNPARLKVGAMLKEMPRKYWKNMPEARLIPELVAGAQAREATMVRKGAALFGDDPPESLEAIGQGIDACRRCPIGCNGTRAVMGEGPGAARLMIVGEQPGDVEERSGRPFVGPAGELLDAHLAGAGIARGEAYVTNAVKHFKFTPRGKRRLHQTPTAGEIDICRWWLDGERGIIRPRHILALGASVARGLLGRTASIGRERGRPVAAGDATLWITVHPSFLLRVPENREREEARFQADLRQLAVAMAADGKG